VFAKELSATKQLVGQLETQLKQIAAPASGHAAVPTTGPRPVTEAEVEDLPRAASPHASPTGSSPVFRVAFADIREPGAEERV
jgi:hypothetical protein